MDQVGPYEIRGELGRGAQAVVWRAYDPKLEREIALKEPAFPPGLTDAARDEYLRRFERECRTAAKMNHPNIMTVFDTAVYDGRPVVATELLEGSTLSELMADGPLAASLAMSIEAELLSALDYAHHKGIVHRDVKPDNIFLTDGGHLKLADFGIAHVCGGTALTQAGATLGSPGYMAPEQIRGEAVDARADIFSAGVVLYEMLSGANPFEAGNPIATMDNTVHKAVPPLVRSDIPATVNEVLTRSLAKDPVMRFASASDMLAALRGAPLEKTAEAIGSGMSMATKIALGAGVMTFAGLAVAVIASSTGGGTAVGAGSVAATAPISARAETGGEAAQSDGTDPTTSDLAQEPAPAPAPVDPKEGLEEALRQAFDSVWTLDRPYQLAGVQFAQDNAGRYWGSGYACYPTDQGTWTNYVVVLVRDGDAWSEYAMAECEGYVSWFWGSESAPYGIPDEVKDTLFAYDTTPIIDY